jgi:hypothetical protein
VILITPRKSTPFYPLLPEIDVINPFLSRNIVNETKSLPQKSQTEKAVSKKIIRQISTSIAFATSGANADSGCIF